MAAQAKSNPNRHVLDEAPGSAAPHWSRISPASFAAWNRATRTTRTAWLREKQGAAMTPVPLHQLCTDCKGNNRALAIGTRARPPTMRKLRNATGQPTHKSRQLVPGLLFEGF